MTEELSCKVCWLAEDGSVAPGVDHPGLFETALPDIGDVIVTQFDDEYDVIEVVERYLVIDKDDEPCWYLVVKPSDLKPGREKALRLS